MATRLPVAKATASSCAATNSIPSKFKRGSVDSKVTIGLIQARNDVDGAEPVEKHKTAAIEKHVRLIRDAKARGAQIVCLQEVFYGPYFCTEQTTKWYDAVEPIPDGPTTQLMCKLAKE